MSDIWPGSCLMGLLSAQLTLMGGSCRVLSSSTIIIVMIIELLISKPHMIHKTLENETMKMINEIRNQSRSSPPVIVCRWILFQPEEDDKTGLLRRIPAKTNNTSNLVFTSKQRKQREQKDGASRPRTHTQKKATPPPSRGATGKSTANTASAVINECEQKGGLNNDACSGFVFWFFF